MLIFLTATCDAELREGMCNFIVYFFFMYTKGQLVVVTLLTYFMWDSKRGKMFVEIQFELMRKPTS